MLPFLPAVLASGLALFLASNSNLTMPQMPPTGRLAQYDTPFTREILHLHAEILYSLPSRAFDEMERGLKLSSYVATISEQVRQQSNLTLRDVTDAVSSFIDEYKPMVCDTVSKMLNSSSYSTFLKHFGFPTSRPLDSHIHMLSNVSHFANTTVTLPVFGPMPLESATLPLTVVPEEDKPTGPKFARCGHGSDYQCCMLTEDRPVLARSAVLTSDTRIVRALHSPEHGIYRYVKCAVPTG